MIITVSLIHTLLKSLQHTLSLLFVFTSRCYVMAASNGDSSALVLMSLLAGCRLTATCLNCRIWTESKSKSLYDWQFISNQFILVTSPLRIMTIHFIFQLNTHGYVPYVTSSLTRGWVCHLQLLLVLASAIILRSKSSMTHDHILLS
jgi:hypothetical protein